MGEKNAKKKYTRFRELLRKGMEGVTQKEFAEKSGISQEHLSRMLNWDYIGQPTKATLYRLEKAMNGSVSIIELLQACDYNDFVDAFTKPEEELTEYQKRLKLPNKERVKKNTQDLKAGFEKYCDGHIHPDFEDIFEDVRMFYLAELVQFKILKQGEMIRGNAENYALIDASWNTENMQVHTYFIVYYAETKNGKIIPTEVSFRGSDVDRVSGIPQSLLDDFEKYSIDIRTVQDVTTVNPYSDAEARLLKAIFGDGKRMQTVIVGFGFYIKEPITEECLASFALKHGKDRITEEEIADIMSDETGETFDYWKNEETTCIICDSMKSLNKELKQAVYQYAKELQIPYIQECYFQTEIYEDTNSIIKVE